MQTTRQMCDKHEHPVPLARTFEIGYKSDGKTRQMNVRYYCRVCSLKEGIKKLKATIPKAQ